MKNHNEGLESILIKAAAEQAAEIHNKSAYTLDRGGREMQGEKHTIELPGDMFADLKQVVVERIEDLREKISAIRHSLESGKAPNTRNAEEELQMLKGKLTISECLEEELFEKK